MQKRNKTQRALLIAFKKGYRIINGELYYKNKKRGVSVDNHGYLFFTVRNELDERYPVTVHRLVAFQKYGKKIFKKGIQVRHLDGNRLNNNEENILIGTSSDNNMDKSESVRMRVALIATSYVKKHNHDEIIKMYNRGYSYNKIMSVLGIKSKGTISFIINKSIQANKKEA